MRLVSFAVWGCLLGACIDPLAAQTVASGKLTPSSGKLTAASGNPATSANQLTTSSLSTPTLAAPTNSPATSTNAPATSTAQVLPPSGELPSTLEIGRNLGSQVKRAMIMRSDVARDKNGRFMSYAVLMGQPAVLAAVDVMTAEVTATYPLPDTSGAWGVLAAGDSVYLACYNRGVLYRFIPRTEELINLGPPFKTNDPVLYPPVEANGKIYGGSHPSGHAYELDPATNKFRDLGQLTTTTEHQKWVRVTVHDPETNKLYFGIGNEPQLVEYDLATGEKREILTEEYADITSVYDLNVVDGRAFCRKETNNPYEYFVLDLATRKTIPVKNLDTGVTSGTFINGSRGMSPKSPIANKMYYVSLDMELCEYDLDENSVKSLGIKWPSVVTGYRWIQLDHEDWPGYTLVGTLGNTGEFYRFNPETGKNDARTIKYPGQPINIHDVETGPDGRIYSGGYLAGNMGIYNPATDETEHLNGGGQTEGMVFIGNRLYMGVYPNGRVFEYDLDKPWTGIKPMFMKQVEGSNPAEVFSLERNYDIPGYTDQDRPFAMAASEDKLFVGTVPKNGLVGGVLAVWDPEKRGKPEVYWNVIPDQSIVSLAYHDGVVYGGSSVFGGLGSPVKANEAELFAWDVAGKKKLWSVVPLPGKKAITQLLMRPNGELWGLAEGTLFVFDPATRRVLQEIEIAPDKSSRWREGSLKESPDGKVYGTIGDKLFSVDPEKMDVKLIATGADKVAVDHDGRLYTFGNPKTDLIQIELEN